MHTTCLPGGSRYHHRDFPLTDLVTAKAGRMVSVCLPARDEVTTIGPIVASVVRELVKGVALVDEVLVVDDGSSDATAGVAAAAGARVVRAAEVLGEVGIGHGKGQAMWKAVFAAVGEIIVFCDADVSEFRSDFVTGLLGPLLMTEGVALVKGFYARPVDDWGQGGGGRVTELVARPLISLLLPHLSEIVQPLAGEVGATREVFERLVFADGYGVDLGLLADVANRYGVASIAQVDLGERRHRNRPLAELGPQATAIIQVALDRAGVPAVGRPAVLVRPGTEPLVVDGGQRPPLVDVLAYRRRSR